VTLANATICVRVDDIGRCEWADLAFSSLLAAAHIPASYQIVPTWLDEGLAKHLERLADGAPVEFCQHGFDHRNQAFAGERSYEFGANVPKLDQTRRIKDGWIRLHTMLSGRLAPVFCPPHDRLDQMTLDILAGEGYRVVLGGTRTFDGLTVPARLVALEFEVDASVRREGVRRFKPTSDIAESLARPTRSPVVGLVLHPAEMDARRALKLICHLDHLRNNGARFVTATAAALGDN
jgi:hypothetical protein